MDKFKKFISSKYIEIILVPIILLGAGLFKINQGVDISDIGYSLYNYVILGDARATWWTIATYLSNLTGHLLQKLPWGDTLIGMNFYGSLIIVIISIIVYMALRKYLPKWILLIGELVAISLCWCPVVILYNYLTYLFVTIAIVLFYRAVIKDETKYYIFAGIFLGINVAVRFSNLVECALILCLWYYGYLNNTKVKEIIKQTFICLLGYIIGVIIGYSSVIIQFGFDGLVSMIASIGGVSEGADSYSLMSMITLPIKTYISQLKWFFYMGIGVLAGIIAGKIPKCQKIVKFGYILGVIVLFRWFHGQGLYSLDCYSYGPIFNTSVVFLLLSIAIYISVLFTKEVSNEKKLFVSIVLLTMSIIPLGSNNHLFPVINYTFWLTPLTLYIIYEYIRNKKGNYFINVMVVMFTIGWILLSFIFGLNFTFIGSDIDQKDRGTMITEVPRLDGMMTNQNRAKALEEAYDFLNENSLQDKKLITYGDIPSLHYYFEMDAYFSTAWIDLDSYALSDFEKEFKIAQQIDGEEEKPVIILSNMIDDKENEKYKLISWLIDNKEYEEAYSNYLITIYR